MTLLFNTNILPPAPSDDLLGCIQMKLQPENPVIVQEMIEKCRNCHSPLFPLDTNELKKDCPICHPRINYSSKSFRFSGTSVPRNHYFLEFDTSIPPEVLYQILNELKDSTNEESTFSVICTTDKLIIGSVSDNTFLVDVYSDVSQVQPSSNYFISKKDFVDVAIPSIFTVFALTPDEPPKMINPFLAIRAASKIARKRPFTMLMFVSQPVAGITIQEAEEIGELLISARSIVHIGAKSDFKRLTAAVRSVFGTVFKIDYFTKGIIQNLLERSKSLDKLDLICPLQFEFKKVTGCTGKVRMSTSASKLKLQNMVGGTIRFQLKDPISGPIKFIERVRTAEGNFLSVHSFDIGNVVKNEEINRMLVLKAFASDVLREVWLGSSYHNILKTFQVGQITELLSSTSLKRIGKIEFDILPLYFLLCSFGLPDIDIKYNEENETKTIIAPPFIYISSEKINEDVFQDGHWPFGIFTFNDAKISELKKFFDRQTPSVDFEYW